MITLRDEILQIVSNARAPICCTDIYKKATNAPDSVTVAREVHQMATDHLLEVAATRKEGLRDVSFYRLTTRGAPQPKAPEPNLQPAAAKVQPNTSLPPPNITKQEPPMGKSQGITPAIVEVVTANPGVKIDALYAAVAVKVPGVTFKQVRDICYVTKAIKRVGHGNEAGIYLSDKAPPQPAAAPTKPKRETTKKPKAAKPTTVPAPVTAKHPVAFDPEYTFAFGVRKDGGVAICKDGISVVLARSEVQTILAHTTQE